MSSPTHKTFLVVDSDTDGRILLVRTLMRVFPACAITESQDALTVVSLAQKNRYDAIVAHRAIGADAVSLVKAIREHNQTVPILAVSGLDRSAAVLAAGANAFLNFDEWLRVGTVVTEMIAPIPKLEPSKAEPPSPFSVPSISQVVAG